MTVHPDTAFSLLSTLRNRIEKEPEETQIYYRLLTIKAEDKLYIPHTSDSLINMVVDFYKKYGDTDKLMEAYYYQGSVYRDLNDAPRAIKAFQQAIDVEEKSNKNTLLGQIYGQMGTLFAYQGLYDESLEAKRKALYYYTLQSEKKKIPSTLCEMARMYDAKDDNDSAVYYYKRAYDMALKINYHRQIENILSELGCLYYDLGKVDTAKSILLPLSQKCGDKWNVLLYLGRIYQEVNRSDSADYYFRSVLQSKDIYKRYSALKALSHLELDKCDYQAAMIYALQAQNLSDSIELMTQTEAVKKVQSLYDYQHTEQENLRLSQKNKDYQHQLIIFTLSFIVFVFVSLYIIHYIKANKQAVLERERRLHLLKEEQYKRSLAYIEANNEELKRLKILLENAEQENDTLNKQLILSQKEMLELANRQQMASHVNRELLEASFKTSDLYIRFHRAGDEGEVKIVESDWEELRIAIDTTYLQFTNKLYSLYPDLSQRELRICYLVKISMSNKSIARLLYLTPSAITQARKRLYRKIYGETGNGEYLDRMILDL